MSAVRLFIISPDVRCAVPKVWHCEHLRQRDLRDLREPPGAPPPLPPSLPRPRKQTHHFHAPHQWV